MRIYTVSSGIDFTAEEQHLEKHVYPVLHAILRGRTRLSWVSSLPGDTEQCRRWRSCVDIGAALP